MSKETEFLKKLRYASLLENDLRKELEELLAQPEQEPVAWMSKENGDVNKSRSYFKFPEEHQHETIVPLYEREGLTPRQGLEEYKKGYARAELDLKREPLSEQAIWNANTEQLFEEGVRWAEQQHRIIGEDDE